MKLLKYLVPVLLLIAGTVLMIIGIRNGELSELEQKATSVCWECIGIG